MAQMNSDTDFSMEEKLIDTSVLAVTACVGFRVIWQPGDVRVIVVSIVSK